MSSTGNAETRTINFAAPSALNVGVIGTDSETNLAFTTLVGDNAILNMTCEPDSGDEYIIDVLRDGKPVKNVRTNTLSPTRPGPIFFPFPWIAAPGVIQFQATQTKGTKAALQLDIIYDHPLVM